MSDLPDLPPHGRVVETLPFAGAPRAALDAIFAKLETADLRGATVQRVPGAVKVATRLAWFDVEVRVEAGAKDVRVAVGEPPRDPRDAGRDYGAAAGGSAGVMGMIFLYVHATREGGFYVVPVGPRAVLAFGALLLIPGAIGAAIGGVLGRAFATPFVGLKKLLKGGPERDREAIDALCAEVVVHVRQVVGG